MKVFSTLFFVVLVFAAFFIGDRYNSGGVPANGTTVVALEITNELTIANRSYYEALPRGAAGHIILEGKQVYQKGQRVGMRLEPLRILSINGRRVQIYREV